MQNHSLPCVSHSVRGGVVFISEKAPMDLADTILGKGLPVSFRFGSQRMLPFIRDSEVITLVPISKTNPHLGDIVAFISSEAGRLLVGRLVGKRSADFSLRGDNRLTPDLCVSRENLLVRVIQVERGGKRLRRSLERSDLCLQFARAWDGYC